MKRSLLRDPIASLVAIETERMREAVYQSFDAERTVKMCRLQLMDAHGTNQRHVESRRRLSTEWNLKNVSPDANLQSTTSIQAQLHAKKHCSIQAIVEMHVVSGLESDR